MKLTVKFDGENHQVSLDRDHERLSAEVDGRSYSANVNEVERRVFLMITDGRVYECRVDRNPKGHESVVVNVGRRSYPLSIIDPKRLRVGTGSGASADDGQAQIIAPMPGKIVRIVAEAGALVAAGDGIIVVEAMKMQNEMKSPRAGTVIEVRVAVADTVNAGDVLAVIE